MKIHKTKLALAATALVAAPVAAQATSEFRASAPVAGESALGGDTEIAPAFIIAALAGVGIAILLLTDDDDEDPVSA